MPVKAEIDASELPAGEPSFDKRVAPDKPAAQTTQFSVSTKTVPELWVPPYVVVP
jgi:hypothetical protein